MFLMVQHDFAILPTFARLFPLVLLHTYFSIHTSFRRILILARNLFTYEQPYLICALHSLHSILFSFLECEAVIALKSGPKHPSYKIYFFSGTPKGTKGICFIQRNGYEIRGTRTHIYLFSLFLLLDLHRMVLCPIS